MDKAEILEQLKEEMVQGLRYLDVDALEDDGDSYILTVTVAQSKDYWSAA